MNLTFSELIDTVVKPYEEDESFFIDGVPLKRKDIQRLKVIEQDDEFGSAYHEIRHSLDSRDMKKRETTAKHYEVLITDLMRGCGKDVTSLVIRAYGDKVWPSVADYLPNRETLIKGAFSLFNEWTKSLGEG